MHIRPGTVLRFIGARSEERVEEAKRELQGKSRQIAKNAVLVTQPAVIPFRFEEARGLATQGASR